MKTGLDPEFLVLDSDGFIVPASIFLPTKEGQIAYDNAAVEIRPKATTSPSALRATAQRLRVQALSRAIGRLSYTPAARLRPRHQDLAAVKVFGCSPSQVVMADLSTQTLTPSASASSTPVRSAGFHVHQEIAFGDMAPIIVSILDFRLGLVDVLVNQKLGFTKASKLRRETLGYGLAGEHRVRDNGEGTTILEYRTLSPWPLRGMASILHTVRGLAAMGSDELFSTFEALPERGKIIEAINTSNPDLARSLYNAD